jgi:hypothetical protein
MVVSHNSKIIFIHIQRTGGSSVINLLRQHLGDALDIVSQHGNTRSKENHLLKSNPDYFTFTFVRNPWDRILSWYLLIYKDSQEDIEREKMKFERFLKLNLAFKSGDPHFHYNQLNYITDDEGIFWTDKVYRFENYSSEVESLQDTLKLPRIDAQKMNSTWKRDYQDYYTKESQEMIAEKCKKDIEYFKYSF